MFYNGLKVTAVFNYIAFSFVLLMSCKSFANINEDKVTFEQIIAQVETLKNQNPSKAFQYLQSHAGIVNNVPLENQLVFFNLQSQLYIEQSQFLLAKSTAEKALELAKRLTSPSTVMIELLYARGFAIESLGDLEGAELDYLNGLEIAESIDDKNNIASGLTNLGAIYYLTENFERALTVFNRALKIANNIKDEELLGYINSEFGILYAYIGEEEQSMRFYENSYQHYKNADNAFYAYNSLRNIAVNHSNNARYQQAIEIYKEIIDHAGDIGNVEIIASAYSGIAWAHLKKEDTDPEAAYQYSIIAGQYAAQSEQHEVPVTYALDKAYVMYEIKKYDEALVSLDKAERLISDDKLYVNSLSTFSVLYLRAEVLFKLKRFKRAYEAKSAYTDYAVSYKDKANFSAIEELRLRYESERADLDNQLLRQQEIIQSKQLEEASEQVDNKQTSFIIIAIISIALAWLLLRLMRSQKQLLKATRCDMLTGTNNRNYSIELGRKYFSLYKKNQKNFAVLAFNIVDFKELNNRHGYDFGDCILIELAEMSKKITPKKEYLGRVSDAEFVIYLPKQGLSQAKELASQLKKAFDITKQQYPTEVLLNIGVASAVEFSGTNIEELLSEAFKNKVDA